MKRILTILLLVFAIQSEAQTRERIVEMMEQYSRNYGQSAYGIRFVDEYLNPALESAQEIICQKNDRELFGKFLDMMVVTSASANEFPADILANIFICRPEMVEMHLKGKYRKQHLLEMLNFGFLNVTSDKKPANYPELQLRLASILQ